MYWSAPDPPANPDPPRYLAMARSVSAFFREWGSFFAEDSGLVEEKVDCSAPNLPRNPELPRSFRAGPHHGVTRVPPCRSAPSVVHLRDQQAIFRGGSGLTGGSGGLEYTGSSHEPESSQNFRGPAAPRVPGQPHHGIRPGARVPARHTTAPGLTHHSTRPDAPQHRSRTALQKRRLGPDAVEVLKGELVEVLVGHPAPGQRLDVRVGFAYVAPGLAGIQRRQAELVGP